LASHWVAVPYEKLIDWIREYLSLIGFILAAIGMFFTVIYSIPQIEHIFDLFKVRHPIFDPIFLAGGILWLLGMCIQKTK
jgi:type II secretory pathway component PulF